MKMPLLLVLALSGCAEVAAIRAGVAEHGADAADQTLESALWVVCEGSSAGAIRRRFQTVEDKAAYNTICPLGDMP